MAVEKLITQHIDTWTSALRTRSTAGRGTSGKIDLYGIKKLRELILELAVRGKLVPQDPNDEPASELLKRIAAEKAELVKQGKIKKQKSLPEISEEEEPFELPEGWEWVRFGDISEIERGGSPRPIKDYITTEENGLSWIKIGDTDIGGKYISSADEKIKPSGLHKTRMVYPGDFLLTNSMSFGRPYITLIEGCIHDGWLRISPPSLLDKDFLYQLLSSPFIIKAFKEKASGAVVLNLNADKVRETFILIPPFSEQQRIVAKVNELMSLCDQLEQQSLASLDAHSQLVETLLATLTDSQNAEELAENWARISQHFDTLFTTEASIDALKQTILQLAVMGKLVPQDPNDEPASELLKRIEQEKVQQVKEGKIKKQKPLPPVSDEEKPFVLPKGWEWVRFGTITNTRLGKMLDKAKNRGQLKKYLRNTNVQWDDISLEDINEMRFEERELEEFKLKHGDLLICEGGEPGRCAVWNHEGEYYFQKALHRVRAFLNMSPHFFAMVLKIGALNGSLNSLFTGVTIKHLPGDKLQQYVIPLMPLKEQERILARTYDFIQLCDILKSRLQSAQQTQLYLADALTDAALN